MRLWMEVHNQRYQLEESKNNLQGSAAVLLLNTWKTAHRDSFTEVAIDENAIRYIEARAERGPRKVSRRLVFAIVENERAGADCVEEDTEHVRGHVQLMEVEHIKVSHAGDRRDVDEDLKAVTNQAGINELVSTCGSDVHD